VDKSALLPQQSSSSPALFDERRAPKKLGGVRASAGDGSEPLWTRQSVQRAEKGVKEGTDVTTRDGGVTSAAEGGPPMRTDRSTIVTNPNYSVGKAKKSKAGGQDAGRRDVENDTKGGRNSKGGGGRPSELPLKKETPL